MLERSRSLQIYMKPGIKEDDLMLRVWDACRRHDRPQDVFRSMLRAGLMAMLESGEMPESVIEDCGLDAILERRRRRRSKSSEAPQPPHFHASHYPPYGYPAPAPMRQHDPLPPAAPLPDARHETSFPPAAATPSHPPRQEEAVPARQEPSRDGSRAKAKEAGTDAKDSGTKGPRQGRIGNLM